MNDPVIRALLVAAVFAVIFGPLTARSTLRREPIYGGGLPKALNLLAAMSFVGLIPGVLAALIFGAGGLKGLLIGMSLMALTFVFLLIFAIVERPAHEKALAQANDQGWTEKDAKTSGL